MRDHLLRIYKKMLLIRRVEETIAEKYHEGKMRCPTHLSIGQECVSACISICLKSDDFAVSTHRGHAHYIGKGGDLRKMIAEIYGKSTGCSKGKGGSMHLIDLDVIIFKKDNKDTRIKHVYLSEKGSKLFNEIFSIQKKRIYKALINSNSKEVLYFNNVLKKIIHE